MREQLGSIGPRKNFLDPLFEGLPVQLSAEEAAQILGVSEGTVYKWLREGVLPGYRLGRTWFILRDELRAALEAGRNNASRPADPGDPGDPGDSRDSGDF